MAFIFHDIAVTGRIQPSTAITYKMRVAFISSSYTEF